MADISDVAPTTGNAYLNSLIWGGSWVPDADDPPGVPRIAYYYASGADFFGHFTHAWTQETDAFDAAFQLYESVADIELVRVFDEGQADVVERLADSNHPYLQGALGRHEVPDPTFWIEPLWGYYNVDDQSWNDLAQGSFGFVTIIHELGHALGLAHPHDGGSEDRQVFPGVTGPFASGVFGLNQGIWTTMSYLDGWNLVPAVSESYGLQGTPMAFDIAALQAIYGANVNYNTGDDTYVLPQTNGSGTFWSCIWDAGGANDALDAAGAAGACTINLNDAPLTGPNAGGFVSYINGILGGLTIANGVTIENATGGNGNDTLVGNEAANILSGLAGNDTLNGGAGNDTLYGGGGKDTMPGGAGDDTYVVDIVGDVVTESLTGAAGGTDTVKSAINYTLGANVENLVLIEAALTATGNTLANELTGNDLDNTLDGKTGADTMMGAAGDDTLIGGAGADSLDGGAGDDSYVIDNAGDKITDSDGLLDTVQSSVAFVLADGLENLTLTGAGAVSGTGNSGVNIITGNGAANKLDGGAGNDTLIGGAGNDTLIGGAGLDDLRGQDGSDTYFVGLGDTVSEINPLAAGGIDLVSSEVDFTLGANLEKLTLTGASDIDGTGNGLANSITGNANANVLDGQGGKDTMVGGDGDDTYVVDIVGDVVTESLTGAAGGSDTVTSAINYTLGANVENLVLIGAALTATGNTLANELEGNEFNNTLDGKTGADTMTGGEGDDTYVRDVAGDLVIETGASLNDEVRSAVGFNDAIAGVEHYTFTGATAVNFTASGSDNKISGTAAADTLAGGAGADTLIGGAGADSLDGGTGDDSYVIDNAGDKISDSDGLDTVQSSVGFVLADGLENLTLIGTGALSGTGNNGANIIIGNGAANKLDGGAGNDTLIGGAGNDTLIGGVGTDSLEGGDGSDTYFVGLGDTVSEINPLAAGGIDLVSSEVDVTLGANLEKLTLTGASDIDGTGNGLANTIAGNAQGNVLDGQGGKDTMAGGAGNDTYVVDIVGDVVTESLTGAAGGTDTVRSAVNYTLGLNLENLVLIGAALTATGNTLANELEGNEFNNTLDGKTGADTMTGGEGDDTYVRDVAGDLVIETGASLNDEVRSAVGFNDAIAGVEHYTFTGATAVNFTANGSDNKITGTAAADTLAGGAGADTLAGGAGADTLVGGAGADSLDGGAGDDSYVIDNAGDKISDSGGLLDTVQSSVSFVLADGLENLTLIGAGALSGTGNDGVNIITGNGAANRLDGQGGNDTLIGGAGNDTLIGGVGTDSLEGGDGSDTYFAGLGDTVSEINPLAAGGIDLVSSEVDFTLGANIEKLTLTDTAISGTGNGLANTIAGNAQDNVLDGQGGKDTMAGGAGDDGYVVDIIGDVVTESLSGTAGGSDTVTSAINYTLGANLENLVLIGAALTATGNTLANELTGNDLANTLNGGLGLDKMFGLLGDDTYVVDNLGDVVEDTGGIDTVQSSVGFDLTDDTGDLLGTVFGQLENLTLTGTATIGGTGNALANAITGNSAANTLTGGAGNDTLNGGAGADSLVGGTENDTYVVDNALDKIDESGGDLADVDTVLSSVSFNLGAATVLGAVENLTLTGTAAISGTGNDFENRITGNSAANTLMGNAGNDTLSGGGGNDTLVGGAGDDALNGEAGNDLVIGGGGDDAIDVSIGNDTARYTSVLDGHDILSGFDGDSLGGGQDVLNLDVLFDSLGVAAANRAALVLVDDQGGTVDIRIDADKDSSNGFEFTIATLNTADIIAVGQDVILGT